MELGSYDQKFKTPCRFFSLSLTGEDGAPSKIFKTSGIVRNDSSQEAHIRATFADMTLSGKCYGIYRGPEENLQSALVLNYSA